LRRHGLRSGGQGRNRTIDTRIFSTAESPVRRRQAKDRDGISPWPTEPPRPTEPIPNRNPEIPTEPPRARSGSKACAHRDRTFSEPHAGRCPAGRFALTPDDGDYTFAVTRSGSPQPSEYRRDGATWLIEIRLRELRQLFHHLDPAPFHEKDLDPAAEAYIEDAVREIGLRRPCRLVVHLPAAERESEDARTLPEAFRHYFEYRARQAQVEFRRLLGRGVASLLIGLAFMFACLSLRRWLAVVGNDAVLAEGLLLIGWVALWRPVEIFLYDWWPIRRQQRRFEFIAQMPVEIRSEGGSSIG